MRRFALCGIVIALIAVSTYARTWTDSTGTYKTEAELVDFKNGIVRLKKADGTVVSLPLERLSKADQQFVKSQDASVPPAQGAKPASNRVLPLGKWVDVLPWVDLDKDCVGATEEWKRAGNSLRSPAGFLPMLTVPIAIVGDYDLEIEFTRHTKFSGHGGITLHFPAGDHLCPLMLSDGRDDSRGGQLVCLAVVPCPINGKTVRKFIPREDFIGKRARLGISVRRKQDSVDIQTTYNGSPLVQWSLDEQTMLTPEFQRFEKGLERLKRTGTTVQVNDMETDFHSIKVKLISGTASHHRFGDP